MRPQILILIGLLTAVLIVPSAAQAEDRGYTLALSLTLGGTSDAEPDPGFGNLGLQATFLMETSPRVHFGIRAGQLTLEGDRDVFDADLSYLTLVGEYRFTESYYESGLFLGLGFYDLAGDAFFEDESSVGVTVGVTGDFRINDRWSVLGEIAGHGVDMDYANFFITGHVGLAYHF